MLALREVNYRFELWNRRGGVYDRFEASAETLARLRAHYEEDRVLLRVPDPPARPLAQRRSPDKPRSG